ncbi:hypothetical protein C2G38_2162842 [Gigaspora rosea]|uniref:Uncharacterized protein n=1 Tax=Gigaspora rosea TaxID=44941 RepID=A0A397VVM5_9GLOM|nr:hypothetical protein C2G38_2162842 [Gigaspora rosea]
MYQRAVPVITNRIDMRSIGPKGLNRQSPSWVVGMATSVEPSGGLLKLDNQKLFSFVEKLNSGNRTGILLASLKHQIIEIRTGLLFSLVEMSKSED